MRFKPLFLFMAVLALFVLLNPFRAAAQNPELAIAHNVVTFCSVPNVEIPDNNPTGVSDTITVLTDLNILDFNVYIRAMHTWVGDVSFKLEHVETATTATLINRPGVPAETFGCSGDNYDVWVDDEGTDTPIEDQCSNLPAITGRAIGGDPPGPVLAVFDGQSTLGNWVLTATDAGDGDIGTLVEWCVEVTVGEPPNIDVDPLVLANTQVPDESTDHLLTITNTGDANLVWNIVEEPALLVGGPECTALAEVSWLTIAPMNGTTAPGATTDVQVTLDSTGVPHGWHHADICISSNDPDPGQGNHTEMVVVHVRLGVWDPLAVTVSTVSANNSAVATAWLLVLAAVAGLALTTLVVRRNRAG